MAAQQNKRITGELGEIYVALELHKRGWQVYRPILDEQIDLVITKYYCKKCKDYSGLKEEPKINKKGKKTGGNFLTNLCTLCGNRELIIVTRFLQVKTSAEGKQKVKNKSLKDYTLHANLRYHVDPRTYYIWIPLIEVPPNNQQDGEQFTDYDPLFYVFHYKDISKFDDINLHAYNKSDNQKKDIRVDINNKKVVQPRSKYDYSCFESEFRDGFDKLEEICNQDLCGT